MQPEWQKVVRQIVTILHFVLPKLTTSDTRRIQCARRQPIR